MSVESFLPRLARACAMEPTRTAFQFASRTVTFDEFGRLVQGIRDVIGNRIPETERRVAILATQDEYTYASIVAVMSTGRAYVPLNPSTPSERNLGCLRQADTTTVLCTATTVELENWNASLGGRLTILETSGAPKTQALRRIEAPPESSVAYLLFTSGSTGVPKGVPVYHRNLTAFLHACIDASGFEFSSDDRFLQMFDLTFDLSIMSFAVPLCVGATCCVVPTDGPGFLAVARTLSRSSVTVSLMVPSALTFLKRYFDEIHLPALRLALFCGEALPEALARSWWKCAPNARLLNVYGPTEATIFCSSYELMRSASSSDEYQGIVSIGAPFAGIDFRIVDDGLNSLEAGEKGELIILGGQVTDHYWRNESRTEAAFVTLPDGSRGYRSGDLAFSEGRNFYYCGRMDNQIKIAGYRVEIGDIEHHARLLRSVKDAVVIGHPSANGNTELHLFLLVDDAKSTEERKGFRSDLAMALPSYMVPHRIHTFMTFPLNQNGKVDRKALMSGVLREE